jgi:HSP20 family protein
MVLGSTRPIGFADPLRSLAPALLLAEPVWRPSADVYETADGLTVTVELAGVDAEEVDVVVYQDALVVEGVRRLPPPDSDGVYHAAELRQGRFRLPLALPLTVDPERGEARYDRGLLEISLVRARGDGDGR